MSGEERTNAITALKGIPVAMRESPTGIAAYVGKGETKPIMAPTTMVTYSFFEENCIFFPRKKRIVKTFSAILMSK
jgi:hypothetical protein